MTGVLQIIKRPIKKLMRCDLSLPGNISRHLELETAKEILAEVFGVGLPEVDEMIRNRFEAAGHEQVSCEEDGLWPQEFWLQR